MAITSFYFTKLQRGGGNRFKFSDSDASVKATGGYSDRAKKDRNELRKVFSEEAL